MTKLDRVLLLISLLGSISVSGIYVVEMFLSVVMNEVVVNDSFFEKWDFVTSTLLIVFSSNTLFGLLYIVISLFIFSSLTYISYFALRFVSRWILDGK